MQKLWITTVLDGRITNSFSAEWNTKAPIMNALTEAMDSACEHMDLSRPIILKKHISEIKNFNRTKFLPEHFMEAVDFDKLEAEIFQTDKKKKGII